MKKLLICIPTLLILGAVNIFAYGLSCLDFADFYYIGLRESVSGHSTVEFDGLAADGTNLFSQTKHKTGWGLHAQAGLSYCNFRLEAEGGYRRNDFKSFFLIDTDGRDDQPPIGYSSYSTLFLNLFYDIYLTKCSGLYIGGGTGFAFYRRERTDSLGLVGTVDTACVARNKTYFAWQGLVGAFYDYHCLRFTLGYSFFATEKLSTSTGTKSKDIPYTQNFDAGIKLMF